MQGRRNFLTDFDRKAKDWDADPVKVERARVVAAAIREQVPLHPPIMALEYGCGTGLLSFALQSVLSRITLADSSPGMLAVLRDKIAAGGIGNMTAVQLDLCVDPLPADRYNLIYTLMTLHHIRDIGRLLNDFHALLKSPGYLCIADLDLEDGSYHGDDFHGHTGFDRHDLQEKLERAGFGRISFSTVYEMTKETKNGRKSFPLFLAVAAKCNRQTA
ncbi:MAG TPA: class I SAM-dependent methyltransferase [Geobacteraceae bacterium]|nr:class I SAM-dependent methyltransferase [Geobacteraceae bacterium]